MDKIDLFNIHIDNIKFYDAINKIEKLCQKENSYVLVNTLNVAHLILLRKDVVFRNIYPNAEIILTDGVPLIWVSRLLGNPIQEKISGSDLFPKLCEQAAKRGYKIFLLGGKKKAASKTARILKKKYKNIKIAGICCPPFGFEKNQEKNNKVVNMVRNASPDILFVGLGAPKQEKWIFNYKSKYKVPVSIGVGASFEFFSGIVKRAPLWMQKLGLEWFWRLMMEPKRLWKRYLIGNSIFIWLVLLEFIKIRILRKK